MPDDIVKQTQYSLPAHVYVCHLAQGSVLLDLRRNRYFGLDTGTAHALQALLAPTPTAMPSVTTSPDAAAACAPWVSNGLLQPMRAGSRAFDPQRIDQHAPLASLASLEGMANERQCLYPNHVAHFLWQCIRARRELRARTLFEIASDLHARKPRNDEQADNATGARLREAVCHFRRLRPYAFAAHDQCLFHALALTRYLITQRLFATWVIGVRLHPWGAHSWVQYGSILLDATPEAVREYKPIIAV